MWRQGEFYIKSVRLYYPKVPFPKRVKVTLLTMEFPCLRRKKWMVPLNHLSMK